MLPFFLNIMLTHSASEKSFMNVLELQYTGPYAEIANIHFYISLILIEIFLRNILTSLHFFYLHFAHW